MLKILCKTSIVRPAEIYLIRWNGPGGLSKKKEATMPPIKLTFVLGRRDDNIAGVISRMISHVSPPSPGMRNGIRIILATISRAEKKAVKVIFWAFLIHHYRFPCFYTSLNIEDSFEILHFWANFINYN